MKNNAREVRPGIWLRVDEKTGIAVVDDDASGSGHAAHPNIDRTGSVLGMKKLGHWGEGDRIVRFRGFIYNISRLSVSDDLDELARRHCRCGGKH